MMPLSFPGLPFEISLWIGARLITFFAVRRPLGDLLRGATPATTASNCAGRTPDEIVAAVKRVASRPWLMRKRRCLREGLLAFHYLSLAGHSPVLHFGVVAAFMRASVPRAHCWVSVEGKTVLNPPAEPMVQVFSYDGHNRGNVANYSRPVYFDHG